MKTSQNKIYIFDYSPETLVEKEVKTIEECIAFKESPSVTWVNIDRVPPVDDLERLRAVFSIHPVVVDDILNVNQRPKIEILDDYIYVVLKMLTLAENNKKVESEQVSIVIAKDFVLTFQQDIEGDTFASVRDRIRNKTNKIRGMGTDYLAYKLIDSVVDNYFNVLEAFSDRLEKIEHQLINNPNNNTLQEMYNLKREVLNLRRSVWPLREVVVALERDDTPLVKDNTRIYLRDVYDHVIQIIDTIETYREMLSGMVDIYLSSVSNKMNAVMKVLTIIATIFMPLTFLAGVYGMNFKHMPELNWVWGYPLVWLIMVTVAIIMLVFFKRKKWL
ncbi:MAG TPA: magnesium and cobalt transport protein CorA [Candidatus Magasanikbacteria bacterium]|nr:magnesium and cobalt transport protein CorA [Candidatus Magasanikbacteria bacterium]